MVLHRLSPRCGCSLHPSPGAPKPYPHGGSAWPTADAPPPPTLTCLTNPSRCSLSCSRARSIGHLSLTRHTAPSDTSKGAAVLYTSTYGEAIQGGRVHSLKDAHRRRWLANEPPSVSRVRRYAAPCAFVSSYEGDRGETARPAAGGCLLCLEGWGLHHGHLKPSCRQGFACAANNRALSGICEASVQSTSNVCVYYLHHRDRASVTLV